MRKQTLDEFIDKYRRKFPEKRYDFSKSVYVNTHTKMLVTCDNGHEFDIRPCDLLNGYGCPVCGGTKKLTKDDFINKASFVHNNYFSYEHCDFTTVSDYVTVTCPVHGDIRVLAHNHLYGANCKKCQKEGITHKTTKLPKINKSTRRLTNEEFKERVRSVWGDRYTFNERTNYEKANKRVIIVCPEHGEFSITPNHLLSGRGCPHCGRNKKKTREEIINEIKAAQPYADYDYQFVVYMGIHKNITLKCNKCGTVFSNSPSNLIKNKNGCPGCNGSQMELEMGDYLIKNGIRFEREKRFEWLRNKSYLPLDFYLPDYNVAIECQGIQHFENVAFKHGTSVLNETQSRDRTKNLLCTEHGIKIYYYANYHIEFPYYVYENKDTMLNDIKSQT